MAGCSSPTDRTPRPRNTWADSGYWKPPIWMRHLHGRRRLPSPAMCPARCASFFSTRLRNKNPVEASKQPGHCGLGTRAAVPARINILRKTGDQTERSTVLRRVKSKKEAIQWADLAPSQEENDAEK